MHALSPSFVSVVDQRRETILAETIRYKLAVQATGSGSDAAQATAAPASLPLSGPVACLARGLLGGVLHITAAAAPRRSPATTVGPTVSR